MHRFLTLRALGFAVVTLALMCAMVVLGFWQLGVYDEYQRADASAALQRPPVPLDKVLGRDAAFPADGVSRPVTVTGRYAGSEQLYARGLPGSRSAYAVTTPLVTPTGSAVLVVRGATSRPTAPSPPAGTVTIRGVLEPPTQIGGPLDRRRVTTGLRIPALVDGIRQDLYGGYVLLRASDPPQQFSLSPVQPPLPKPSRWAGIRNLVYAIQWWLFAGFVAFMWWRMTNEPTAHVDHDPAAQAGTERAVPLG